MLPGHPVLADERRAATLPGPQPITVTSEYAEIIYFVRNGNLYRRVLLVAPERQTTVASASVERQQHPGYNPAAGNFPNFNFCPNRVALNSNQVSWQGVNDISAHPAPRGRCSSPAIRSSSTRLGDLTSRENRFAQPAVHRRFLQPARRGRIRTGWRRPQRRQRSRLLSHALSHRHQTRNNRSRLII